MKYVQHEKNTCLFSSLESSLYDTREHVTEKAIDSWKESSLKSESLGYLDKIKFANKLMTYRVRGEIEEHHRYKILKWKNRTN